MAGERKDINLNVTARNLAGKVLKEVTKAQDALNESINRNTLEQRENIRARERAIKIQEGQLSRLQKEEKLNKKYADSVAQNIRQLKQQLELDKEIETRRQRAVKQLKDLSKEVALRTELGRSIAASAEEVKKDNAARQQAINLQKGMLRGLAKENKEYTEHAEAVRENVEQLREKVALDKEQEQFRKNIIPTIQRQIRQKLQEIEAESKLAQAINKTNISRRKVTEDRNKALNVQKGTLRSLEKQGKGESDYAERIRETIRELERQIEVDKKLEVRRHRAVKSVKDQTQAIKDNAASLRAAAIEQDRAFQRRVSQGVSSVKDTFKTPLTKAIEDEIVVLQRRLQIEEGYRESIRKQIGDVKPLLEARIHLEDSLEKEINIFNRKIETVRRNIDITREMMHVNAENGLSIEALSDKLEGLENQEEALHRTKEKTIEQRERDIDSIEDEIDAHSKLQNRLEKASDIAAKTHGDIIENEENSSVIKRGRNEVSRRVTNFVRGPYTNVRGQIRTEKVIDQLQQLKDNGEKAEKRLARVGRAILGLVVTGVLLFLQSFLSILTAIGAQAVALVSSLVAAAAVIGGTLVSAAAQAIPVLGLLAGVMQRLGLVGDALTATENAQKDAFKGSESAAKSNADAKVRVLEAEEALAEARREAIRELEDLAAAERDAELAMRDSILTRQEAKDSLEDTIQSGSGSIARSFLEVDSSRVGVQRARTGLQRARQDRRRTPTVDDTQQVKSATKSLADAMDGLAESEDNASAASQNLEYALSQLTDSERRLVDRLVKFRKRVSEAFTPITDIIIDAFTDSLGSIENLLLDSDILSAFTKLSRGIAKQIELFVDLLTSDRVKDFWINTIGNSADNLRPIGRIFRQLFEIFMNLAEGAAPVFAEMLSLINGELETFKDSTSDKNGVTSFFETGLENLRAWGRLLKGILNLFGALIGASSDSAITTLDDLTDRLNSAAEYIRENREEVKAFFDDTARGFGFLIDIIVGLGALLVDVFSSDSMEDLAIVFNELLVPAFEIFIHLVGLAIKLISFMLKIPLVSEILALALGLRMATSAFGAFAFIGRNVFLLLSVGFGVVRNFLAVVWKMIKGTRILALAFRALTLATGIGAVITAVALAIIYWDEFSTAIGKAVDFVSTHVNKFLKWLEKEFPAGFAVLDFIYQNHIKPFIAFFVESFENIKQILGGVVDFIVGIFTGDWDRAWGGVKDIVTGMFDQILNFLDTVTQPFENAGKAIGDAFGNAFTTALDGVVDAFFWTIDKVLGGVSTLLNTANDLIDAMPGIALPPGAGDLGNAAKDAADNIDSLREQIRGEGDDVERAAPKVKALGKEYRNSSEAAAALRESTKKTGKETKTTTEAQEDQRKKLKRLGKSLTNISETLFGSAEQSGELGDVMKEVTNKILSSFGADKLEFSLPNPKKLFKKLPFFQSGGFFGGEGLRGPDDRLVSVAGGEAFLTGHHQRAIEPALAFGKAAGVIPFGSLGEMFSNDKREHRTAFQKGGQVPGGGSSISNPSSAIVKLGKFLQSMGYHVSEHPQFPPFSPGAHSATGFHPKGLALDINADSWSGGEPAALDKLSKILSSAGWSHLWRVADHFDHLHVDTGNYSGSMGGLGIGGSTKMPSIEIKGPDSAIKDMLQGQSKELRKEANTYLGNVLENSIGPHNAQSISGGLSAAQVAKIARQALGATGVPVTPQHIDNLVWLAKQESGFDPNIVNTTDINAMNGDPSRGLMQVIGQTFDAYKLPGMSNILNPLHNMVASIRYQLDRYGHIIRFSPYARGGVVPEFDRGGVVPGPIGSEQLIKAHGGETVLPTHKFQTGGRFRNRFNRSMSDLQSDTKKFSRGAGDNQKLARILNSIIRDGGSLDDVATAFEVFAESASRNIQDFAFNVRNKMASQTATFVQINKKELNAIEEQSTFLNKQLNEVESLLDSARQKLKKADSKREKQILKQAINNLIERQSVLEDAMLENIQERLSAQNAVFDAAIERIQQRISTIDLVKQLEELRSEVTGEGIDTDRFQKLIGKQGKLLRQEGNKIEREIEKARRAGNFERVRELRQALLQNQIAILENTKALNDLEGTTNRLISFNSTPWQLFRQAIMDGAGNFLPQYEIPQLHTGGRVTKSGLFELEAGEAVTPLDKMSQTNTIYITEPMEVADPVALSNAIAFKFNTTKATDR